MKREHCILYCCNGSARMSECEYAPPSRYSGEHQQRTHACAHVRARVFVWMWMCACDTQTTTIVIRFAGNPLGRSCSAPHCPWRP